MKNIAVIIATYNGMKWIDECLKSVYGCSISVELLVIDNNSSDLTINFIRENFPQTIIFEQKVNLGFGKANNIGISYALKNNFDYVFLLNQDAFLEPNTLRDLVKTAESNPEYGILSPIQKDYSGKFLESSFHTFMTNDYTKSFYSDYVLQNKIKEIYDVDFVQAAAWLLPLNTIKKIGGFDPVFFHYGEDNNYCQRVLYHKLKIGVVSGTFIRHDSTKSLQKPIALFSDRYFNIYKKRLAFKYADINEPFSKAHFRHELMQTYKILFFNILVLNFQRVKGSIKQLSVLKKMWKLIKISRAKNVIVNSHYLNFDVK